jgi:hypothetical protein
LERAEAAASQFLQEDEVNTLEEAKSKLDRDCHHPQPSATPSRIAGLPGGRGHSTPAAAAARRSGGVMITEGAEDDKGAKINESQS